MVEGCESAEDFMVLIKVKAARDAGFPSEEMFRSYAGECAEDVVMNWEPRYAPHFERWMLGGLVASVSGEGGSSTVADRVQAVSLLRIVLPSLGGGEYVMSELVRGCGAIIRDREDETLTRYALLLLSEAAEGGGVPPEEVVEGLGVTRQDAGLARALLEAGGDGEVGKASDALARIIETGYVPVALNALGDADGRQERVAWLNFLKCLLCKCAGCTPSPSKNDALARMPEAATATHLESPVPRGEEAVWGSEIVSPCELRERVQTDVVGDGVRDLCEGAAMFGELSAEGGSVGDLASFILAGLAVMEAKTFSFIWSAFPSFKRLLKLATTTNSPPRSVVRVLRVLEAGGSETLGKVLSDHDLVRVLETLGGDNSRDSDVVIGAERILRRVRAARSVKA